MDNNQANPNTGSKGVFPGNQPAHTGPQQTVPGQNQQPQQPQVTQEQPPVVEENIENTNTYMKLETKNPDGQVSGVLEIDLISFRERGKESRYLSVNLIGMGQDGAQSDTTISIGNEQDFNKFKEFIANLNWND
jgi:hypothetical protein